VHRRSSDQTGSVAALLAGDEHALSSPDEPGDLSRCPERKQTLAARQVAVVTNTGMDDEHARKKRARRLDLLSAKH
jgi:hypothetical protein